MLEENNDIIIVDDSLEDVHRISNVFLDYGIGCRTFVYDYFDTIETPLKNVKIAFLIFACLQQEMIRNNLRFYVMH